MSDEPIESQWVSDLHEFGEGMTEAANVQDWRGCERWLIEMGKTIEQALVQSGLKPLDTAEDRRNMEREQRLQDNVVIMRDVAERVIKAYEEYINGE